MGEGWVKPLKCLCVCVHHVSSWPSYHGLSSVMPNIPVSYWIWQPLVDWWIWFLLLLTTLTFVAAVSDHTLHKQVCGMGLHAFPEILVWLRNIIMFLCFFRNSRVNTIAKITYSKFLQTPTCPRAETQHPLCLQSTLLSALSKDEMLNHVHFCLAVDVLSFLKM